MLKLNSVFLSKILRDFKLAFTSKIRNFYSKKFNNRFFLLALNLEFKIFKNHTKIKLEDKNLDRYSEKSMETNQELFWFISSSLRPRAVNSYSENGLFFSGYRIARNYALEKIVFNSNDIVIDCGANFGSLWIYLNSFNLPLQYICIEPGRLEFMGLKKSITFQKDTKINSFLINKALSFTNGETNFFYSENSDSSIIAYEGFSENYLVETITLESLLIDIGLKNKNIKLLKLEAEGAEPEVIKGSLKTLKNIEYIAADLGPERGLNQESTLKEVTNILLKNNFEIIDFKFPRLCLLFKNICFD
tara:strand:- start:1838 stop:2749 length:912 start_codon:yes stop_codon:yes gene_type:complete